MRYSNKVIEISSSNFDSLFMHKEILILHLA